MLDYNKLLDDWADMIYEKVDFLEAEMENEHFNNNRYHYLKGHQDAYLRSLAMLSLLEKRKKHKYIIKEESSDVSK